MARRVIGVSKVAPNYEKWLLKLDDSAEIIDLYHMTPEEAVHTLKRVSGILLTGGSDIHPSRYGREDDLLLCKNIDERRDALELAVISRGFQLGIPILGICRGQQILNVAAMGSLYADIEKYCHTKISHSGEKDVEHPVSILEGSLLYKLTGVKSGIVNSAHHQAISLPGKGFRVCANAPEDVIEAIEYDHGYPFCLAVQWHPERMDIENPLSGRVGKGFIDAMR